jgi:predicted phosphodiesterase
MIDLKMRFDGESFDDYFVRLFENAPMYNLKCQEIADLLNEECGEQYNESKWRKDFKLFDRGRIYERNKFERGVVTRILSISDLHVPFQKPIETFEEYIGRIDILQINGDVCDFAAISKFPKAYRSSPMEEMIAARQYLIDLIEYLRPKKVVVTYGNHDIRFQTYLIKNLDSDILELMPETSLELICVDGFTHYDKKLRAKVKYEPLCKIFDNVEIEYTGSWFCKIGRTIFCHPLAFKSGIMKTSQDALTWFRNEGHDFDCLVMAHTHRLGSYVIGNTVIYEQGACCETKKMHYNDGRLTMSQKEGFLYLCLDKDGNLLREQSKLISIN